MFDYVQSKGLKIRNAQRLGEKSYKEDKFAASSDEELDPYKEKLKDDARERAANSDSDSEDGKEIFFGFILTFKKPLRLVGLGSRVIGSWKVFRFRNRAV